MTLIITDTAVLEQSNNETGRGGTIYTGAWREDPAPPSALPLQRPGGLLVLRTLGGQEVHQKHLFEGHVSSHCMLGTFNSHQVYSEVSHEKKGLQRVPRK